MFICAFSVVAGWVNAENRFFHRSQTTGPTNQEAAN